jgi:hypothetical protein
MSTKGLSLSTNGNFPMYEYMWVNHPDDILAYPDVICAYAANHDLGSSASVATEQIEVYGEAQQSGVGGKGDASPPTIVYDLFWEYSGLGFPSFFTYDMIGWGDSEPGSFGNILEVPTADWDANQLTNSSWYNYCWAQGIDLSVLISSQEDARSIVERIARFTNTSVFWAGSCYKAIPYATESVYNAPFTFVPYLTPRYNLTDNDIVLADSNTSPIKITRADPSTLYNTFGLQWVNRENQYQSETAYSHDQASMDINAWSSLGWYGTGSYSATSPKMASVIQADEVKRSSVAKVVIELIKQREVSIRNTYEFKLPWIYCDLEPMDIVTLTDLTHTGLNQYPVRITSIEEDSDSGEYTITAEDLLNGTNSGTAGTQSISGIVLDTNVAAKAVHTPIIFEPPQVLSNNTLQMWIAVSGGDAGTRDINWGGCDIWCSLNGTDYTYYGKVQQGNRTGYTASVMSSSSDSFDFNMTECQGTIDTGTYDDQTATLMYVDGELISYTSASLASTYVSTLSILSRGRYGTVAVAHSSGVQACCVDSTIGKFNFDASYVGRTIYIKLQSYNIYGRGMQELSECVAYTYNIKGSSSNNIILNSLMSNSNLDLGEDGDDYSSILDLGDDTDIVSNTFDLGEDA